jgi:hypothetical protein
MPVVISVLVVLQGLAMHQDLWQIAEHGHDWEYAMLVPTYSITAFT